MSVARLSTAALGLAVLAAIALPAHAEEATRLLVEVSKKSEVIAPGDSVSVQVVGVSDTGARVGFDGRSVELRATTGAIGVVKRPYKFLYTAPAAVDGPTEVVLRARLAEAPNVRGKATLRIVPREEEPGTYRKLILRTQSQQLALGAALEVEILGDTGSGPAAPLTDRRVTLLALGHTDPAGEVGFVKQGVFRYTAPSPGGAYKPGDKIRLVAALDRGGSVRGETSITLTRPVPDEQPDAAVPPRDEETPVPPVKPRGDEPADVKPSPGEPEAGKGLLFPSKNVRVMMWRTKDLPAQEFQKSRALPSGGTRFIAPAAIQKLRFVVERQDVKNVTLEWYVGKKKGAKVH